MKSRTLPEASVDIQSAAQWYEQQRPGLGDTFTDALEVALHEILADPRLYPKHPRAGRQREVRHHLLDGFPYQVFYQLLVGEVVILAVVHTSRDLRFLSRRHA